MGNQQSSPEIQERMEKFDERIKVKYPEGNKGYKNAIRRWTHLKEKYPHPDWGDYHPDNYEKFVCENINDAKHCKDVECMWDPLFDQRIPPEDYPCRAPSTKAYREMPSLKPSLYKPTKQDYEGARHRITELEEDLIAYNSAIAQPGNLSGKHKRDMIKRIEVTKAMIKDLKELSRTGALPPRIRRLRSGKETYDPHEMSYKQWSKLHSFTFPSKLKTASTFYPKGTMTKSAKKIYKVSMNPKYAPGGPGSAIKWLTYYMNRAGKKLKPRQRKNIKKARRMLQKKNKSGPYRPRRRKRSRARARRVKSRFRVKGGKFRGKSTMKQQKKTGSYPLGVKKQKSRKPPRDTGRSSPKDISATRALANAKKAKIKTLMQSQINKLNFIQWNEKLRPALTAATFAPGCDIEDEIKESPENYFWLVYRISSGNYVLLGATNIEDMGNFPVGTQQRRVFYVHWTCAFRNSDGSKIDLGNPYLSTGRLLWVATLNFFHRAAGGRPFLVFSKSLYQAISYSKSMGMKTYEEINSILTHDQVLAILKAQELSPDYLTYEEKSAQYMFYLSDSNTNYSDIPSLLLKTRTPRSRFMMRRKSKSRKKSRNCNCAKNSASIKQLQKAFRRSQNHKLKMLKSRKRRLATRNRIGSPKTYQGWRGRVKRRIKGNQTRLEKSIKFYKKQKSRKFKLCNQRGRFRMKKGEIYNLPIKLIEQNLKRANDYRQAAFMASLRRFGLLTDDTKWTVLSAGSRPHNAVLYTKSDGGDVTRWVPSDSALVQSEWITIPAHSEARRVIKANYPQRFDYLQPDVVFRLFEVVSEKDLKFLQRKRDHRARQERELAGFLSPESAAVRASRNLFACDNVQECRDKLETVKGFLINEYPGILQLLNKKARS